MDSKVAELDSKMQELDSKVSELDSKRQYFFRTIGGTKSGARVLDSFGWLEQALYSRQCKICFEYRHGKQCGVPIMCVQL